MKYLKLFEEYILNPPGWIACDHTHAGDCRRCSGNVGYYDNAKEYEDQVEWENDIKSMGVDFIEIKKVKNGKVASTEIMDIGIWDDRKNVGYIKK